VSSPIPIHWYHSRDDLIWPVGPFSAWFLIFGKNFNLLNLCWIRPWWRKSSSWNSCKSERRLCGSWRYIQLELMKELQKVLKKPWWIQYRNLSSFWEQYSSRYQLIILHIEKEFKIPVFHKRKQSKSLRIFHLAVHSHLYSMPWDFYFFKLTQPLIVSAV
jgi:hypothetical protein